MFSCTAKLAQGKQEPVVKIPSTQLSSRSLTVTMLWTERSLWH